MVATFDYADMLATADELIAFFGQTGTLVIPGTKTGDAWNPTIGSTTTESCTLVEIEYNRNEIDGTNVLSTDRKLYIKAGGLAANLIPSATQITYGGTTKQIVQPVKQLSPAGTNMFWEVQARI